MSKEKLNYYFGYGSNMSLEYLQGRRGVYPVVSYPGLLKGFSLIMNMEGPIFVEPSFANIIKNKNGSVEGVLHLISKNELQKIINTEGEDYEVTELSVEQNGKKVKAKTLIYKTSSIIDTPPSRRYMRILIKAAKSSGLSNEYILSLEKRPYVYYPILSEIYAIRVFYWVWSRSRIKT
ncbi:MAG: gamma-glutamylcyclotransferase family protein [Paracoccaceae bacterium]